MDFSRGFGLGKRPLAALIPMSVVRFAGVSATGLALDLSLFAVLAHAGARPGIANVVSATFAVAFVYFASVRRVFAYGGSHVLPLYGVYCAYQILAIGAASWAVDTLATLLGAIVAKLAILPATFFANYAFMRYITRGRRRSEAV